MRRYTTEVEDTGAAPPPNSGAGPVYRCVYSENGLLQPPAGVPSPWHFFRNSVEKFSNKPMLGHRLSSAKGTGEYLWTTYEDVYKKVIQIGSAIRKCGISTGGRCGIYGANCPEWITAMEACKSQSVLYIPLYDTLGANAVEFIIGHADIALAFVQESKIPTLLKSMPSEHKCPLKVVVSFGSVTREQRKDVEGVGLRCFSWDEFAALGEVECELPEKKGDDVCTIMYTSGTTGEPKGVVMKNEAIVASVLAIDKLLFETDKVANEEDVYFSFLPLAHIFDQIMETYCIYKGSSIGFWRGDVRYLIEDIQALRPTIFCGVPRVYERIYDGMIGKVSSGGTLGKKLFQYAYDYKLGNLKKGLPQERAAPLFDRLVFEKVRAGLGGRIRLLLSGAAPLPHHVEEFLRVACCCVFSQGYGLTESCGGCFTSLGNVFSMTGTVGVPMPTTEARLVSVPEMGYDALSNTPRGEICIRGTTLFSGYYKREDLTNEVIRDGWFHTGDIGEWRPDGVMKIIDRKKNIFKLSQGEYVAVETLESTYMRCPLITMIWVYGNSLESFLVSVAVPDIKAVEEWAKRNCESGDFKSLCQNPDMRQYFLQELNIVGKKHQLRGFEMLKAVHLDPRPFDIERDMITPTFKLKRPQLLKYYKDCIDKLYTEAKCSKK